MKHLVLQLTLLGGTCGLLTSLVYESSAETIRLNQLAYRHQQLTQVAGLPASDLTETRDSIFVISHNQETLGIIFPVTTDQGYNGTINRLGWATKLICVCPTGSLALTANH
jgi:Na+-translocating ferredoxin:NAD+ oxidoreductase RnfG subunit